MCQGEAGVQVDTPAIGCLGVVVKPLFIERDAEIVMKVGQFRIDGDCPTKARDGIVQASQLPECVSAVVLGIDMIGLGDDDLAVDRLGFRIAFRLMMFQGQGKGLIGGQLLLVHELIRPFRENSIRPPRPPAALGGLGGTWPRRLENVCR